MHFADPDHREAIETLFRIRRLHWRAETQIGSVDDLMETVAEVRTAAEHLQRLVARVRGRWS